MLLRKRNMTLRDGTWRAQEQQQLLQQQQQAQLGTAARHHASATASSSSSSAAAAAAAATVAARSGRGGMGGVGEGRGGDVDDGLATIGICLEYDCLLGLVFVSSIRPGGSAALSGKIAVGDVIVDVDGKTVSSLEDAADVLVGPCGSLVVLKLLWRGKTAHVALVRQHTLILPQRQQLSGADAAGIRGGKWGVDIGAQVDFVKGLPTITEMREGGAAASSQGLQHGDVILAVNGENPCSAGGGYLTASGEVERLREALNGAAWSRVILTVQRGGGIEEAVHGRGQEGGERGKGVRQVAVVRAPDITGDEVLFAAEVAYQAALVEAVSSSWLDGPKPAPLAASSALRRIKPAAVESESVSSFSSEYLEYARWRSTSADEDGSAASHQSSSNDDKYSGRSNKVGGLGAAVRELGEELGGTANLVLSRSVALFHNCVDMVSRYVQRRGLRAIECLFWGEF